MFRIARRPVLVTYKMKHGVQHLLDGNFFHANKAYGAAPQIAGTAMNLFPKNLIRGRGHQMPLGIRGAEDGQKRHIDAGSNMHWG